MYIIKSNLIKIMNEEEVIVTEEVITDEVVKTPEELAEEVTEATEEVAEVLEAVEAE